MEVRSWKAGVNQHLSRRVGLQNVQVSNLRDEAANWKQRKLNRTPFPDNQIC